MKLNRVLLIRKPYGAERRDRALGKIKRTLGDMGIYLLAVSRFDIPRSRNFDLIITFGGDGTFLAAAHAADGIPVLGVNAAPDHSVGFFCAATPDTFDEVIAKIARGRMRPRRVPLIESSIGGRKLPRLALNDVLFAGGSPAETVRYTIAAGGRREEQKSSGVWISAGPGSTAAISSAGGKRLGIESRRLQFLVREPCPRPGSRYRMTRGVLSAGSKITIVPNMRTARVYIDGHWNDYPAKPGTKVTCKVAKQTLNIFI